MKTIATAAVLSLLSYTLGSALGVVIGARHIHHVNADFGVHQQLKAPLYGGCKEWRPAYGPKPRQCRG